MKTHLCLIPWHPIRNPVSVIYSAVMYTLRIIYHTFVYYRQEYVNHYISYIFNTSIHRMFSAFYDGFHKVCGSKVLVSSNHLWSCTEHSIHRLLFSNTTVCNSTLKYNVYHYVLYIIIYWHCWWYRKNEHSFSGSDHNFLIGKMFSLFYFIGSAISLLQFQTHIQSRNVFFIYFSHFFTLWSCRLWLLVTRFMIGRN